MKHALLLTALLAMPALAQTPPAIIGQPFIPAPWWMKEPVIAAMGHVRVEVPANRARFQVRFAEVGKTAAAASAAATARARALDGALAALGAERVRLTTSLSTRPLYDQYRDKEGKLVENRRADQIDAYEVTAVLSVEVRDMGVLERSYRLAVAAEPSAIDRPGFSLEPDNETQSRLAAEAVKDAARRAQDAATAAGTRLGPVKIIDPTGRVCTTQVLAGWPSYGNGGIADEPTTLDTRQIVVRGARMSDAPPAPAPPPPPSLESRAAEVQVTLQPPLRTLSAQACIIRGLLPAG